MFGFGHAACCDPDFVAAAGRAETQAGPSVHMQAVEIAGVHLNDSRAGFPRQIQILLVENLRYGFHAEAFRLFAQVAQKAHVRREADDE